MTAVAAYRPTDSSAVQFRYTPQVVQTLNRGNNAVYSQIQKDVAHLQFDTGRLNVSPRVPKEEIRFVKVGQDEYFMGGPCPSPAPFFPVPTKPGCPGAPNGTAPVFEVPAGPPCSPPFQPPVGGPQPQPQHPGQPLRYTQKFGQSFDRFAEGQGTILQGAGQTTYGVAKAAIYAPAGALEGVGRAAVALTGGKVVYEGKTPLQHMGDGFMTAGEGVVTMAEGTGKSIEGAAGMVVYAPLAGLELTARAAGVAAGGVAAVGYGIYKGAAWTGKQVKESFVGQEFLAGFNLVAGAKPQ